MIGQWWVRFRLKAVSQIPPVLLMFWKTVYEDGCFQLRFFESRGMSCIVIGGWLVHGHGWRLPVSGSSPLSRSGPRLPAFSSPSSQDVDCPLSHIDFMTSSITSKKPSRLEESNFRRPRPSTNVLRSSGFLRARWLAICAAYSWPTVSRSSPPPPRRILGSRWTDGRRDSSARGIDMSTRAGEGAERGTWT